MADQMPKVNLSSDKVKLNPATLDYMRLMEQQNLERVLKLKRQRRNNLITAALLGASVFGIYAYSIAAVKQEKFLDELDEPAKK